MLMGIPRWVSPRSYYVVMNVYSFQEILRMKMFNLLTRVKSSANAIINRIIRSDASHMSALMYKWNEYLYVNPSSNSLFTITTL